MVTLRGGWDFPAASPIRLPAPPETLAVESVRLACAERPEVHAGQIVRQGQALLCPTRQGSWFQVSPISGIVRGVHPLAAEQAHAPHQEASEHWVPSAELAQGEGLDYGNLPGSPEMEHRASGYELTIEAANPLSATTLEVLPPRGQRLETWFSALRRLGAWAEGDGGVGLIAQLAAAQTHQVDTVICVGLDPYSPVPDSSSLLVSFPDDAVLGTIIVADLVGAKTSTMLVNRSRTMMGRLGPVCEPYPALRLVGAPNRYPAANPTLVAWTIAGKRALPHGANPVSRGLMMLHPWTAIRIGRWFTHQRFDIVRPIFIAWPGPEPVVRVTFALPGQPVASLDPRLAQHLEDDPGSVLAGNPMTGRPIGALHGLGRTSTWAPPWSIPEDTLLISVTPRQPRRKPEPCIACGWCAQVCPTSLRPIELARLAINRRDDDRLMDHLPWCVDCGLCSHVCPSSLPLAQTLRHMGQTMYADDHSGGSGTAAAKSAGASAPTSTQKPAAPVADQPAADPVPSEAQSAPGPPTPTT